MQRQQYCRAAGSMWHGMWWCDPERAQARHGAMEPTSAPWRMAASLDCVRSCTPLSFVSRCRGSTRTFRLSKRAFVVMPRIDRPVSGGEPRPRVRVSHSGDVRTRVGRSLLVSRAARCCSAYTVTASELTSHRSVSRLGLAGPPSSRGCRLINKLNAHPARLRTREQAEAGDCGNGSTAHSDQCGSRGRRRRTRRPVATASRAAVAPGIRARSESLGRRSIAAYGPRG
jgi:hypothetical protein